MTELFRAAFHPGNLIYTILLMVVLVYWITVFIGLLDLDFMDVEVDSEVDLDMDTEVDVDADAYTEIEGGGWLIKGMSFFNLGKVPFMVFFSFLALTLWSLAMFAFDRFGEGIPWIGLFILLPNFFLSLFITKGLTWPFLPIFRSLNREASSYKDLVGKVAVLRMEALPQKRSQAEVLNGDHSFLINVRSEDEQIHKKGEKVLLVEYREEKNEFLITHFDV